MSVPNTMRVGPFTPTILARKRYLIFYIFLIWVSIIPLLLEFWVYWRFLWSYTRPVLYLSTSFGIFNVCNDSFFSNIFCKSIISYN